MILQGFGYIYLPPPKVFDWYVFGDPNKFFSGGATGCLGLYINILYVLWQKSEGHLKKSGFVKVFHGKCLPWEGVAYIDSCTSRKQVFSSWFRDAKGITATVNHLFVPCGAVVPWRCRKKNHGKTIMAAGYPTILQGFSTIPGGCLGFLNHQR